MACLPYEHAILWLRLEEETVSLTQAKVNRLVARVVANFRTFGGGRGSEWNPLAEVLKDSPPQFAAGVNVEQVVRHVIEWYKLEEKK